MTYRTFSYLNSNDFVSLLGRTLFKGDILSSDFGLNGGGWHVHSRGGKLNTHLDYSLHPKTRQQRKLNIIVYLNSTWQECWGEPWGFGETKVTKLQVRWSNKSLRNSIEQLFLIPRVIVGTACQTQSIAQMVNLERA